MDNMRLEWGPQAIENLFFILGHISDHNVQAAQNLYGEVRKRLKLTLTFPQMYRASTRMDGVREIVVTANYIVPYRVTTSFVEVIDVVHARRNWPDAPAAAP